MHQIKIVNNPFDDSRPAWEDIDGRLGVRIGDENTVWWYNVICIIDNPNKVLYYAVDEVAMYVDEPFNDNIKVRLSI